MTLSMADAKVWCGQHFPAATHYVTVKTQPHWSLFTMPTLSTLEWVGIALVVGYFVCWAGIPQIISDIKNIWSWIRNKV